MNHRRTIGAAFTLLLATSSVALAQTSRDASPFTLSAFALPMPAAPGGAGMALAPVDLATALAPPEVAPVVYPAPIGVSPGPAGTRYDAVRYRPRYERGGGRGGNYVSSSPVQVHFGFFEPNGDGNTSFAFGFRGGPSVDPHIQLGLGADWYHRSDSQREVLGESFQGGQRILTTRVLARASSNLFPVMAFMQVSGGDNLPVIPYAGIGGDYQALFLSATDFQTGADFSATYGGWGWQVWGGAAFPLSGQSRAFGEVFASTGDVERDVDTSGGFTLRERVKADGVGMRFGLNWGF
jgi:hypothetical protein